MRHLDQIATARREAEHRAKREHAKRVVEQWKAVIGGSLARRSLVYQLSPAADKG